MILQLSVIPPGWPISRARIDPARSALARHTYHDSFGNFCSRDHAGAGPPDHVDRLRGADDGTPDPIAPQAKQHALEDPAGRRPALPARQPLLRDRSPDDDGMVAVRAGAERWPLVQAICDFVHGRIAFNYSHANPTRTAFDAYSDQRGVCRDFAHLAVALCRCMNIPARYCTGYLGDIGVAADPAPMDFSAWFEAYLGERWYTFDARHNRRASAVFSWRAPRRHRRRAGDVVRPVHHGGSGW